MSQQLATWIGPHIDSGERFAEQLVEVTSEVIEVPEFMNRKVRLTEESELTVDGERVRYKQDDDGECERIAGIIKRVIAAAFEHGRDLGQKEGGR